MIRFLPFVIIAVLILGGLGYFRFVASKSPLTSPTGLFTKDPIEVPKTLPEATEEDRIRALENLISKVVVQLNGLKTTSTQTISDASLDSLNASITELKARVSSLENATPAPAVSSSSKSTVYIPLGSGGTLSSVDWTPLNGFLITLDPSQYPGYTSMNLEVNMRLNQPGGTVYGRLYNNTSGSATSSEVTSTSTNSSVNSSSNFTLPSGSKTYVLQAKSSDGSQIFIDTARIKVNF